MTALDDPREIVEELDKHIVGQKAAKRAVAIALRNRWRREQVAEPLRHEITPKNILMIGPTGRGQDRDRAPPGAPRQGAVHQGGGHQVHRSGLCRPRSGLDRPRSCGDLRQNDPRGGDRQGAPPRRRRRRGARAGCACCRRRAGRASRPTSRRSRATTTPGSASARCCARASSTTARSRSRCARCPWASRSWRRPAWRR